MREREKYFVSKAHEKNIKVTQQANNYIGGGFRVLLLLR